MAARTALALGIAGFALRLYAVLVGSPPTNSDEATMGLAAFHIANGSGFPMFFYGQHYMGTLEAYLAVPLFKIFGPSVIALRLPLLPFYAIFLYVMYRLSRRLYSAWFAVFIVGLLALGSDAVLRGQIIAGGGYPEIKPMGAGLLLIALWVHDDVAGDRARRLRPWKMAAFGTLAGLAVWDDPLVLPYLAGAALLIVHKTNKREWVALAAGATVGMAPVIWHNVTYATWGHNTVTDLLFFSHGTHATAWQKIYGGVILGIPLGTGIWVPSLPRVWSLAWGVIYPLLLLIAAGLSIVALRRAAAPERIIQYGRLALLLGAAGTIFSYARTDAAGLTPNTSMRYLSILLLSLPAVLWPLWQARGKLKIIGLTLLVALTAYMSAATVTAIGRIPDARQDATRERVLMAKLEELRLSRIYAGYWTCARLAFASREELVCAAVLDDLSQGDDRYLPYRQMLATAPNPAYVFEIGSPAQVAFARYLSLTGVPVNSSEAAGYRIYQPAGRVAVPWRATP